MNINTTKIVWESNNANLPKAATIELANKFENELANNLEEAIANTLESIHGVYVEQFNYEIA